MMSSRRGFGRYPAPAPPRRGNKYKAVGVLACRRCRMVVACKPKAERENPARKWDEDRMRDWHTPGHPDHDCDGTPVRLDSKLEARTWLALCEAEDRHEIADLERQVRFDITINGRKCGHWTADFTFTDHDRTRVVDTKGFSMSRAESDAKFRRRVVEAIHGIEIEIWKKGETAL